MLVNPLCKRLIGSSDNASRKGTIRRIPPMPVYGHAQRLIIDTSGVHFLQAGGAQHLPRRELPVQSRSGDDVGDLGEYAVRMDVLSRGGLPA